MAKPLKFHQTLNQAPRSAKHGQHRRARPQAHRDPVVRADYSAGWPDQGTVWVTYSGQTFAWVTDPIREPEPVAIPYAGIRTGELTAYRAWFVVNDYELRSLAHHYIWEPRATIYGDTTKPADDPYNITRRSPIMGGVYTHLSPEGTLADITEEWAARYPIEWIREAGPFASVFLYGDTASNQKATVDVFLGIAIGSVKLWGEVVEHERGYRAEYAKLTSIDQVCGVVGIDRLRAKYLKP